MGTMIDPVRLMYVPLPLWDDKSRVISVETLERTCKWLLENKSTERDQLRTVTWISTYSSVTGSMLQWYN